MEILENKINSDEMKYLLKHEFTHVLGTQLKGDMVYSGYSRSYDECGHIMAGMNDDIFSMLKRTIFRKLKINKRYEQFNEACVDMFALKEDKEEIKSVSSLWNLDYELYTNVNISSYYVFNSQFVNQMTIGSKVSKNELFEGLFDYKKSNEVIRKFGTRNFKKLAKDMDILVEELNEYSNVYDNILDKYYDEENNVVTKSNALKKCSASEIEKIEKSKSKVENRISKIEKTIIDKMLLKNISKMDESQRKKVLEEYSKFIIKEKEYFEKTTGFSYKKTADENRNTWEDSIKVDLSKERTKNNPMISKSHSIVEYEEAR